MRVPRPWVLLPVLLLMACAKPPPPLLTITAQNCVATPALSLALPVLLKADTPTKATLDDTTACLQPAGQSPRLYAVFSLPQASVPYFLSVSSQIRGRGVLAPYVVLLDGTGTVRREISHDNFMFRGSSLYTAFHPQVGEQYLLVASDPNVIGQKSSGIVGVVQTTTVATGTGFFMMNTGRESTQTLTRAHGGVVEVAAELIPQSP